MSRTKEAFQYNELDRVDVSDTDVNVFDLRVNQLLILARLEDRTYSISHIAQFLISSVSQVEEAIARLHAGMEVNIINQSAQDAIRNVMRDLLESSVPTLKKKKLPICLIVL
jgi:broad-specificity NMP kinase